MSTEYEDTPAGEEKTGEAGGELQDVEIAELEQINDLSDKATVDDSASMEEREDALTALKQLVLKFGLEEHHDPALYAKYEGYVRYLEELYQQQDEQNKHTFIEYIRGITGMVVQNIVDLMESNGGQSNPMEEAKQPAPWDQLGLSQDEWERTREEGARHGEELEIPPEEDNDEEEKREVAKAKGQQVVAPKWKRIRGRLRKVSPAPAGYDLGESDSDTSDSDSVDARKTR